MKNKPLVIWMEANPPRFSLGHRMPSTIQCDSGTGLWLVRVEYDDQRLVVWVKSCLKDQAILGRRQNG